MEKNFKFAVAAGGVLGVIGLFLPMVSMGDASISMWDLREASGQVYLVLIAFLLPAAMGIMGIVKGAMVRWMAITALVGAALAILKVRDGLSAAIGGKLMFVAAILALAGSIALIVKPESDS